eukprot:tig00020830_g14443.t1
MDDGESEVAAAPADSWRQRVGFGMGRAVQLFWLALVPTIPAVALSYYPGALEAPGDRRTLFMYSGSITGLCVSFSLVCWGSLVYGWEMSLRPRSLAVTVGVPLLVYCGWYWAGVSLMAYAFPLRFLELPLILPAVVAGLYVPSCASSVAIWNRLLRRRLHPSPTPLSPAGFEPVELDGRGSGGAAAATPFDSDPETPLPPPFEPPGTPSPRAVGAPSPLPPAVSAPSLGAALQPEPRRTARSRARFVADLDGCERDCDAGAGPRSSLDGLPPRTPLARLAWAQAPGAATAGGPDSEGASEAASAAPPLTGRASSRAALSVAASSRAGGPARSLRSGRRQSLADAPDMAWRLLKFMGGLTVQIYPMWGYIFLFALFENSGVAQVFISIAFSLLSFFTCFAILRVYRNFLCDLLPDHGGPALALLWLLHLLRSFRLLVSFRSSSDAVLVFGVVSDAAVCFAPLLAGSASKSFARRLHGVVSYVLTRPMRRLSSAIATRSQLASWRISRSRSKLPLPWRRSRSLSHSQLPQPPPSDRDRERELRGGGAALVRESGRALFFLQALASIMASVQFVVILTVFRFGTARVLFPYHEEVLPGRGYAACLLAAAASVAILSACLGAAWLLSSRPTPPHVAAGGGAAATLGPGQAPDLSASARVRSVKDGFEIGWAMVDLFGKRIAGMWMTSVLITTAAMVKTYNIFAVVFPSAFVPSGI